MRPATARVLSVLQKHTSMSDSFTPIQQLLMQSQERILSYRTGQQVFNCAPKGTIYANHFLDLSAVSVVGFDLDYTLVAYTQDLQHLIYDRARDLLVHSYGYPAELQKYHFDPSFAVRGLSVDIRNGVLCKLSHLQRMSMNRSYKGKTRLSVTQLEALYGDNRHVSHGELSKMRPLNDEFSSAEACLIADAMQCFQQLQDSGADSGAANKFVAAAIIDDVQGAIREVHVSGTMQNAVLADPERFIKRSPNLERMLVNFRKAGKQLFLATNSKFSYTTKAIEFALGVPEKSGSNNNSSSSSNDWKQLFDVIICAANKPDFYFSRRPFRKWITRLNCPDTSPLDSLQQGSVYVQGSSREMQRLTGWQGHEILYAGDNLRTDLVEARRWHGWHTACIINELERETDVLSSPECHDMHFLRSQLRKLIHDLQYCMQKQHQLQFEAPDFPLRHEFTIEEKELLAALQDQLFLVNKEFSELFTKHFGSMFRTDGHPSLFAFMLLRYVDVYMSDATDFINYNPQHRFFPHHAVHMAHDPRSSDA